MWNPLAGGPRPDSVGEMSDLTVPKRRLPVTVTLAGGMRRDVVLFLAEGASGHGGGERLSDLLNGGASFIPALEVETQTMTFLNRSAVIVAEAGPLAERAATDDIALPVEHEVELTLDDGRALRGHVSYVLPPDHARVADHLNDGTPFLALHGDAGVQLVNKLHVIRVVLLES
jgi:hypothetical protein